MPDGERRLAAIMFTDVVGYSALSQENESATLSLLEAHRRLIRPIFASHGGREIKTIGDAFLVEFGSALDATLCAIAVQGAMNDRRLTTGDRFAIRVGVHVGDVVERENDVLGDAVNIASRIEPLAGPGGICLSEQVFDQVHNKVPYALVKLERRELKNVSFATDVYRVELPWEKASVRSEDILDAKRLAVLPLDNISPDPNDEYFAAGLTDELITVLSRVKGLEVIARTSILRYKGGSKQVAVIGRELQVGSVLEGSVRKAGNRIRVTAQLINASNEAHLWAEAYDRQLDDVFAVQSEIAGKVAEALRLKLSHDEVRPRATPNLDAYTLHLKGKYASTKLDIDSMRKAIDSYEKAITLAPDYAACYADLAQTWLIAGFFELVQPFEAFAKAKTYALKALDLDDAIAEGHVAMGRLLRLSEWKYEEADQELKRAVELEPNLAAAHAFRAQGLMPLGRNEEAALEARRALELDPFSSQTCQILGTVYLYSDQYKEAAELYERALEIDPDSAFPLGNLGLTYVQMGDFGKGISLVERANSIEGANPSSLGDLAYSYGKAGRMDDVRKVLQRLLDMRKDSRRAAPAIAGVYVTLGEYERAFEWLDRALEEHTAYLGSVSDDFIFDPLRSDPRFKALLAKIGIPGT